MDRPLEDVLRALIGSDPHADLDDKQREAFMYALLGMISREKREAVWQFTDSITDEFLRSNLLHKLVQKTPIPSDFRLAKRLADSIPIAYWRYSSVIHIASELLKFAQACRTLNAELLGLGLDFIREAEANIPLVAEDDRSSIVWEAGLTLVRAGELDWAEKLANCSSYCPENTEVLLRVARERAAKGEKDHAIQLARKVAELAISGSDENGGRDLTNRAFDVSTFRSLSQNGVRLANPGSTWTRRCDWQFRAMQTEISTPINACGQSPLGLQERATPPQRARLLIKSDSPLCALESWRKSRTPLRCAAELAVILG